VKDKLLRKPIFFAAVCSTTDNLKYLVEECKSELFESDKVKITPLMLAAKFNCIENLKYIISKVDNNMNSLNLKSKNLAYSAIHYAAKFGHHEAVRVLCENNANIDNLTSHKETAFLVAAKFGHLETLKVLKELGIIHFKIKQVQIFC
jgi:ankyrin repeat protein